MPIQLNYLNPQGLAQLAGQNVGNMNLPVVGLQPGLFQQSMVEAAQKRDALGLQNAGLQQIMLIEKLKEQGLNDRQAQEAANKYNLQQSRDQQAMARTLAQEQGSMNRQMMQTQLGYDQLGSLNQYRDASLGLGQAKLQETAKANANNLMMQQQQQALEQYKVQLQEQMKLGEQKVAQRASFMASLVKNAPKTDDAGTLDAYYRQGMEYGVKTGAFNQDEANQFISVPTNMKRTLAEASVNMSNTAVNYLKESKSNMATAIEEADKALEAAGRPKLTDEQKAQFYTEYAFNLPKKNVAPDNISSEITKTIVGKPLEESMTGLNQANSFLEFNSIAQDQLKFVPDHALGPVASFMKLDNLIPEAQRLQSTLSSMTILAKNLVGLTGGSQGMTEGEWKMVKSMAGGTFQNKDTLKSVLETMRSVAKKIALREWNNVNNAAKQINKEYYQGWLANNPKPTMDYLLNGASFNMEQAKKDHPDMTEEQIIKAAGVMVQ